MIRTVKWEPRYIVDLIACVIHVSLENGGDCGEFACLELCALMGDAMKDAQPNRLCYEIGSAAEDARPNKLCYEIGSAAEDAQPNRLCYEIGSATDLDC